MRGGSSVKKYGLLDFSLCQKILLLGGKGFLADAAGKSFFCKFLIAQFSPSVTERKSGILLLEIVGGTVARNGIAIMVYGVLLEEFIGGKRPVLLNDFLVEHQVAMDVPVLLVKCGCLVMDGIAVGMVFPDAAFGNQLLHKLDVLCQSEFFLQGKAEFPVSPQGDELPPTKVFLHLKDVPFVELELCHFHKLGGILPLHLLRKEGGKLLAVEKYLPILVVDFPDDIGGHVELVPIDGFHLVVNALGDFPVSRHGIVENPCFMFPRNAFPEVFKGDAPFKALHFHINQCNLHCGRAFRVGENALSKLDVVFLLCLDFCQQSLSFLSAGVLDGFGVVDARNLPPGAQPSRAFIKCLAPS